MKTRKRDILSRVLFFNNMKKNFIHHPLSILVVFLLIFGVLSYGYISWNIYNRPTFFSQGKTCIGYVELFIFEHTKPEPVDRKKEIPLRKALFEDKCTDDGFPS